MLETSDFCQNMIVSDIEPDLQRLSDSCALQAVEDSKEVIARLDAQVGEYVTNYYILP